MRGEYFWPIAIIITTVVLAEIPYFLAYSQASRGLIFTGMLWYPHDFAQYGAAMHEGAASASWLIHDHLTGEPHNPAFIYPFYVALGKLASFVGADFRFVYRVADVASRAVLVYSIYSFNSTTLKHHRHALLAVFLTVFSGGMAVASMLINVLTMHNLGINIVVPETSTFLTLFTAPHLVLGLALVFLGLRFYILTWTRSERKDPVLAGACTVALGIVNPFSLVTVCTSVLGHLAIAYVLRRRIPLRAVQAFLAVMAAASPFLLYSYVTFNLDPFWGIVYGKENILPSPPPLGLASGYGVVLGLAVIGAPAFLRNSRPERWLVPVSIAIGLVLMYSPVAYQRRFGFGLQPLLATMAVPGLIYLWQQARQWRTLRLRILRLIGMFLLCFSLFATSLVVYRLVVQQGMGHGMMGSFGDTKMYLFQPRSVVDAGKWLSRNVKDDDVILADVPTSNMIARWGRGRVFIGHPTATLGYEAKAQQVEKFFSPQSTPNYRRDFLAANHIRYFFYGPDEQRLIAISSDETSYLKPVYSKAGVVIYEVALNTGGGE